ncbi:MAG: LamG-like jellyroll fold domain-containing protein [Chitinophagaceae bacterium]|jgi:hypothetical protein
MKTKKFYPNIAGKILAFVLPAMLCNFLSKGQLVSGDAFLQGKYVELGIAPNGCYGSQFAAPAGYHPRSGASATSGVPAAALGFVADPDKDGWTSGTRAYMGDYFLPGNPWQYWALQVGAANYRAERTPGATYFTAGLTGSNVSVSTIGSEKHAIWQGSVTDMTIEFDTYLDTNKLFFAQKIKLKNTGSVTKYNIYYVQAVNPDNDGDIFPSLSTSLETKDTIVFQSPEKTLVVARGESSNNYLGLGSKDCRAKVFRYMNLSSYTTAPNVIFDETGGSFFKYSGGGAANNLEIGIVFKIDSLQAGDSTTLSYAYILKQEDLDSAFLQIKSNWLVDGVQHNSGDTISACQSKVLDVKINNGDAFSWTWSPGTNLLSTTGKTNAVTVGTNAITYRAIGTSISSPCGVITDTIYLTVKPLPLPLTVVDTSSPQICLGQSVNINASAVTNGNALDFNGSPGNYVTIPNSPAVSLAGSTNFTVSTWLYPRSNKHQQILFHGLGCSSWNSWTLSLGGLESTLEWWPKKLGFMFMNGNGSGYYYVAATDTVIPNQWVHVAVTYDGASLKIYLNGVLNNTAAATGSPWNSSENLYVGFDPGCGGRIPYNGKIDEVQIWNKTRTAGEILGSYDMISSPSTTNLTGYWRFDENNGKNVYDVTSNANYGTITGDLTREIPSTAPITDMATGPVTYTWAPVTGLSPTTGASVTANPTVSTLYTITTNHISSGCSNTSMVRVQVNPLPLAPVVTTPVTYCQGATAAALSATALSGMTLKWYTVPSGGTASTATPTPGTATVGTTTYYVSQTITATGCEGPRGPIVVNINATPNAPVVTTPIDKCLGDPSPVLTATKASPTDTVFWYTVPSGGTRSLTAPVPSTATTGTTTYYASLKTDLGCEGPRAAIVVNVNPIPTAPTVTTPVTYCQGVTALALTATAASSSDTLKWYNAALTPLAAAPTPSTATVGSTDYWVSAKSSLGCEGNKTKITVVVNPTPALPTSASPIVYCQGFPAVPLTATAASASDTLRWFDATPTLLSGAPTPSTATVGSTTYYVSQKNSFACEGAKRTITVMVNTTPAAPAAPSPVTYCQDEISVALTGTKASPSDTLKWYNAALAPLASAPIPATTTPGTYTFYVSDKTSLGCEGPKTTVTVQVNPKPAAPTVVTPIDLCVGVPASPLAATGINLKWYTLATGGTSSPTLTPAIGTVGAITYYVSQTSLLNCEGPRAALTVNVRPSPVVTVTTMTAPAFVFCVGDSVALKAISATAISYQWYRNTITMPGSTRDSLTVNTTADYGVIAKNIYGCADTETVSVIRNPLPVPHLSPEDVNICDGVILMLYASPARSGYKYEWFKDGLTMGIDTAESKTPVNLSGGYTIRVTDIYGCVLTTNVASVNTYPVLPTPTIVMVGGVLNLTLSYASYQWYRNGKAILGATGSSHVPTFDGIYTVKVNDINGCDATSGEFSVQNLGIREQNSGNKSVSLYPNPTQNKVSIEASEKVNLKVTDITGKLILQTENATEADLQNYADGIYMFYITDTEGNLLLTQKVWKKN